MGVDEDFCVVFSSQQQSSIPCIAHLADSSVLALVLLKIFSDFMLTNVDTLWSLLCHAYEMPSLKLSSKSSLLCLYIPHRNIKKVRQRGGRDFRRGGGWSWSWSWCLVMEVKAEQLRSPFRKLGSSLFL